MYAILNSRRGGAVKAASAVLLMDNEDKNIKALYRRGHLE
jgi:hypothetical protein